MQFIIPLKWIGLVVAGKDNGINYGSKKFKSVGYLSEAVRRIASLINQNQSALSLLIIKLQTSFKLMENYEWQNSFGYVFHIYHLKCKNLAN
jgi:hypothetical protein